MSSLPEDIYIEILLRVPGKSAFACKFVCKTWYSIISNPDFVKKHLSFAKQTNNYTLMLQDYYTVVGSDLSFRSISHDSLSSDDAVVKVMDFPSKTYEHSLLGSCDGLVYGFKQGIFILWNPATNEFKRLPRIDDYKNSFYGDIGIHGFGYDYKNDDYKLVSIRLYQGLSLGLSVYRDSPAGVYIYSLKLNSWRSFKSEFGFFDQWDGVLFNGAVHWIMKKGRNRINGQNMITILSMDISEENFKELQLPMEIQKFDNDCISVGVVDECLCVLVNIGETFDFELWAMQDYGNTESCTKLYDVTFASTLCNSCSYNCVRTETKLIRSLKNGEILFRNRCCIILYNPKCGTVRVTNIQGLNMGVAVNYLESLVSLNTITALGRR